MALFDQRKKKILENLDSHEPDLSPKGSPDAQILDLLELINSHEDYVTTSSCSGRVAVFVDGAKTIKEEKGHWLMTSHTPFDIIRIRDMSTECLYKIVFGDHIIAMDVKSRNGRIVTLKFEPLVRSLYESLLT
jgi:tRNA wybutosine-synthesizing protein 3